MVLVEEWKEWKNHPVTQAWFKEMARMVEERKSNWSNSLYQQDNEYLTKQNNAFVLGEVSVLNSLLNSEGPADE